MNILFNNQEKLVCLSLFLNFNFYSRMMIKVCIEDFKQAFTLVKMHWPKIYINKEMSENV